MNVLVSIFQSVLEFLYGVTGDYGVSIVMLTLLIRTILVPINIRQRRQMKKQREISKEAEKIKEKFRKNEQRKQEELQKFYQKQGPGIGGCLLSLLQLPIMICLYNAIRITVTVSSTTVILPWISSLLLRDPTLFLPIATLVVQVLPQVYPYIQLFQGLELQKSSFPMVLVLLFSNGLFVFAIPAGVGLYYLVSGIFIAAEQFIYNLYAVYKPKVC